MNIYDRIRQRTDPELRNRVWNNLLIISQLIVLFKDKGWIKSKKC